MLQYLIHSLSLVLINNKNNYILEREGFELKIFWNRLFLLTKTCQVYCQIVIPPRFLLLRIFFVSKRSVNQDPEMSNQTDRYVPIIRLMLSLLPNLEILLPFLPNLKLAKNLLINVGEIDYRCQFHQHITKAH